MITAPSSAAPDWARWLDSMEGVPEYQPPPPAKKPGRFVRAFERAGELLPGVGLAFGLAVAGDALAKWIGSTLLGFEKSPVSAVPVAVILGLVVRNTIGVPAVYEPGLRMCVRVLLRVGIVLLGLRLTLATVGTDSLAALPLVAACITTGYFAAAWLGRVLGLPQRLAALIGVGTSICGVSAILASAAAIDAEEDEVSYAVATITLFGLIALFAYPFFAFWALGGDPRQAGMFLGTAIHDTAQVTGAGLIYQQQYDAKDALTAATVTKLLRNACMAAVIPLMAAAYLRSSGRTKRVSWHQAVPGFVLAFLAATAVRSVGDLGDRAFGVIDRATWAGWLGGAEWVSNWCLVLAMVSVGLGTGLGKLRVLGLRPLAVGLVAALLVGAVSLTLLTLGRALGWV